ncbi:MAG: hypothetical protein A2Z73_07140 [Deltaproteobacteria bacterium RBG_13_60_28]|nr:MAG: hypothetical protein A2Z73_07140 [Deltaproteobacteria bacterium RBG_13_60_28]
MEERSGKCYVCKSHAWEARKNKDDYKRMVYLEAVYEENGTTIGPQFVDKRESTSVDGRYGYYSLNKTGAFIVRFLLQGVPDILLSQLYAVEFKITDPEALETVRAFIKTLVDRKLIQIQSSKPEPEKPETYEPPSISDRKPFSQHLTVNFDVGLNLMGGGGFKIPPR